MPNPFDKSGATATADAAPAAETEAPAKRATPRNGTARKAPAAQPAKGDGFDAVDDKGDHKAGKAGDPFSTPGGVSEYKITELLTGLLLVKPTEVIEEMDTDIGQAENVIRADVAVLTDTELHDDCKPTGEVLEAGTVVTDMLVFNMALKRALLRVLDGPNPYLLGRLGLGTAKKGKNAPYIFERPDEDDATLARQFIAVNPNW